MHGNVTPIKLTICKKGYFNTLVTIKIFQEHVLIVTEYIEMFLNSIKEKNRTLSLSFNFFKY
jgi:hypothetical protein